MKTRILSVIPYRFLFLPIRSLAFFFTYFTSLFNECDRHSSILCLLLGGRHPARIGIMNFGLRLSSSFKDKVWKYVKDYPVRVVASSFGLFFSVGRFLLKSRIQFGYFVPNDETFLGRKIQRDIFLETLKNHYFP